MKIKILLSVIFLSCNVIAYTPMSGPLCLDDLIDSSGHVIHRGLIMKTLQSDIHLHPSMQSLCRFAGVLSFDQVPSYQHIMEQLSSMPAATVDSDAAIQAFEYAIMYAYDKQIYILGGYTQYLSIFVSGLRWRAFNPFSYLNLFSWLTENHEKALQLLLEFEQLVNVAYRTNSVHYSRLYATLAAYKHWFKVRAVVGAVVGSMVCVNFIKWINGE